MKVCSSCVPPTRKTPSLSLSMDTGFDTGLSASYMRMFVAAGLWQWLTMCKRIPSKVRALRRCGEIGWGLVSASRVSSFLNRFHRLAGDPPTVRRARVEY